MKTFGGVSYGAAGSRKLFFVLGAAVALFSPAFLRAESCQLYPIAVSTQTLSNVAPGTVVNIFNGSQPGGFGWLSWAGSPSEPTLVKSLTPPGDSDTYVNPDLPSDHQVSVGDWVQSKPGVSNSKGVRNALDALKSLDITIPVWDQARGQGEHAAYHVAGFATVRLISYQLPGNNQITARFLGYAACGGQNLAPVVNAGADLTNSVHNLPVALTLSGSATDDGLPVGGTLTSTWSVVSGAGPVTFGNLHSPATTATFSQGGLYLLQLAASDSALSATDTVVVSINLQNSPPQAFGQTVTIDEDTTTNIMLTGSDPDNDSISFQVVSLPQHGTLSGTPPQLTYTPEQDYNGSDSFTFKANDGQLDSAVATVNILINPVNDAPVADAQSLTNYEDTPFAITLSGSDVEGSTLTYALVASPTNGTLSGTAPNLVYTPATNYFGADSFSFKVNDGTNDSAPAIVDLTILPVDDAPLVNAGSDQLIVLPTNSVALAGTVVYDNFPGQVESVEWVQVSGPSGATFSDVSNAVTTVTLTQSGVYEFRLTASDSFLTGSDDLVVNVDAPPIAQAGPNQTNTLPAAVTLNGTVTDDGIPTNGVLTATWSMVTGPGAVVFGDPASTNTSATFSEGGLYVLRLTGNDGVASSSSDISVLINRAPMVDAGPDQVITNLQVTLNGSAVDDGLPATNLVATWSMVSGPGTASFSPVSTTNAAPTTAATFSATGVYVLRLTADDSLASRSADVTISVDAPPVIAVSNTPVINFPATASLSATAADDGIPSGAALAYHWSKVSGPGTVSFADDSALATTASFSTAGVYVIQFQASDTLLTSSSNITVTVNQPPVAQDQSVTVVEDAQVNLVLQATDAENQSLTYTIVSQPAHGALALQSGGNQFQYTPGANFFGGDSFTFKVNDGYADSPIATVTLTVLSQNDPPSFVAGANQTSAEDAGPQSVSGWASNISPGPANESAQSVHFLVSSDNPALFSAGPAVAGDGTLTYTTATNANGSATVTVRAQDDAGTANGGVDTSAPQSFTITITAVDDAPRFSFPGSQTIGDAMPLVFDTNRLISISDVDAGAGALQLSIGVAHGTLTLGSTNGLAMISGANGSSNLAFSGTLIDLNASLSNLTYTSTLHYSGAETLTLSVNDQGNTGDGGPLGDFESVAITVVPTNHAPMFVSTPVTNTTALILKSSQTFDPQTIDLSPWSVIQYEVEGQGPASWVLSQTNTVVTQTLNSDPSMFVSDFTLFRDRIQGSFQVNATDDDDFIGFIFGFQNTSNFYVFDWKQGDQAVGADFAERGMTVKVVTGPQPDLWPTFVTNSLVHTIYHNTTPWQSFTNYQFTLDFQPGDFTITIANGSNVLATIHLNDTTYPNGKFGFYNFSQDTVRYSGFTQQREAAQSYVYQAVATDPDSDPVTYSIANGPTNMTINATNGSIRWFPDPTFTGTVSVTIQASDNHGGTTLQVFNILVPPPLVNKPPFVNAGPDQSFGASTNTITLHGTVVDDGLPTNSLTAQWTKLSGPGTVTFGSPTSPVTTAAFSANGIYVLQLFGSDSLESSNDFVKIRANVICSVEPPPNMVAWMPGDFSAEDVVFHNPGTTWNVLYPAGKVGPGFSFNGTDSFARLPAQTHYDVGASPDGFSVETWISVPGFQNSSVLGWANGVRVERINGGSIAGSSLRFFVSGTATNQFVTSQQIWPSTTPLNQFFHVVFSYDRPTGLASIYVNGVLNASANVGTNILSTAGDFYLGQVPGSVGFFTGLLDEVSLYSRPLSPEEIFNLFSAGSVGKCPVDGDIAPVVDAGPDVFITGVPGSGVLTGSVTDDGLPVGSTIRATWSKFSGPGTVTFANSNSVVTSATFSTNGIYILQLTADDGEALASDLVEVRVESLCSVTPAGLAAWWPGNGSEREALHGYDAVLANGANFAAGEVASAFNFDGIDDYVRMPAQTNYDVANSPTGFSVEFWINAAHFQDGTVLGWANGVRAERFNSGAASGDSLRWYLTGTNSGQFLVSQRLWAGGGNVGKWAHLVLTYQRSSGIAALYVNGLLNASANVGTNLLSTAGDFYLQNVPGSTLPFFTAQLDEISLYSRPLNPEEIFNLFSSGTVGKCPDDSNAPPVVFAGPDLYVRGVPGVTTMQGAVSDDGQPANSQVRVHWTKVSGPGAVSFADASSLTSSATFSTNGIYVLQLTADDGEAQSSDFVEVRVEDFCSVDNPPGLAAWWPGNGIEKEAINGYDAIMANGAGYAVGEVATAFNFDGVDDYVQIPAQTNYDVGASPTGFSVEFWLNAAHFQDGSVLGWANGVRAERFNSGAIGGDSLRWYIGGTNSGQFLVSQRLWADSSKLGQWMHIVLAYQRSTGVATLYVNGLVNASGNVGTNILSTAGDFYLENVPGSATPFSTAELDELSLYSRPLSRLEVLSLFTSGSMGKCLQDSDQIPHVYAGPDITIASTNDVANLSGFVTDDGLPAGSVITTRWQAPNFNPGTVTFGDFNSLTTTATFSSNGVYSIQLLADDGEKQGSDFVEVRVGVSCPALDIPGLVAWWPANGNAIDKISGIPAILMGADYTNGKVAQAFNLHGTNDFVFVPAQTNYDVGQSTNGFSIEFWTRGNFISGSDQGVWSWNNSATNGTSNGINMRQSGFSISCDVRDVNGIDHSAGGGVAFDGNWHHFAVTYDRVAGQLKAYTDGVLRSTTAAGVFQPDTRYDLQIGRALGFPAGNFHGQFDEIALYNRAISLTEVQSIFNAGIAGKCITPGNMPPVVSAGPDKIISLPTNTVTLDGAVFDDALPSNALAIAWTYIAGDSTVFFSSTNTAATTVTFTNTGNYTFQLTANDGQFTASDTVTISVLPDLRARPTVTITAPEDQSLFQVPAAGATNLTITATAADADGQVTNVEFFVNGSSVGTVSTAPYAITVPNLAPATYVLTAVATDNDGLSTTSALVTAIVFVDPGGPEVGIFNPADSTIVTAPTNIIGIASSPLLQSWQVRYRLAPPTDGSTDIPTDAAGWATLATGSTSVVSNTLASFDPTMLLNGIYQVQVVATDLLDRSAYSEVTTLVVDRNLKIGNFTLSFSDLTVPVAGVPIEIVRTYDSRDQRTNDFGVGWSLDIRNVRLQKNRTIGPAWFEDTTGGLFPTYFIDAVNDRDLTVTLANGREYKFTATFSPESQLDVAIESGTVIYKPTADTYATLESVRGDDVEVSGSIPGTVDLFDVETGGFYDPTLFKLTTEEGEVYIIDENEGLKSLTDRNGNTLLISTNGVLWTNTVTGGAAVGVSFVRDPQGRISQIIDPQGNALNYAYGTNGSLAAFTDRETNTTTFAYTNLAFPHYLTGITDPRGVQAIRTEYDDSGRMIRQTDGAGNVVEFTHDLSDNREIVRDRLGNVTIHEYDDDGNIIRTTDPLGNITTSKYDANDNLLEQVDALGNTNSYTYDTKGNKLSETDPLGFTTHYTYGQLRTLTSLTTPRGFTTTNSYDPDTGALLQELDPLENVTGYSYDGDGNLLTRTDALGNVMSNLYDSLGHMTNTTVIDAVRGVLNSTSFTYDTNGNQLSKSITRTTPHGSEVLTTSYVYDKDNRLLQTTHPDGSTNVTIYALGLNKPAVEIDALGRQTLHSYDERGNLTNTIYADSTSESFHYDAENRKVAMVDRAGRLMSYGFDPLARMTNTVFADGASSNIVYDAIGRVIVTADERGNTTHYTYDPNCGCSGRQAFITNALGQVTHRSYDEDANESSMIDALGRTMAYGYDALDRQTNILYADGTFSTTTYDAIGRRIAGTDQSTNTTQFAYDALGRLIAVTNALGKVTTYGYDEVGSLVTQTDADNHTTTYEYDSMGRRTKRTLPLGQIEIYQYDLVGNLTNKTDFNGHSTAYAYDAMSRLLTKTPDAFFAAPVVAFTYTATGQRATMNDTGGATVYLYNSRDWLTNKAWTPVGQASSLSLNYTYDSAGNLASIQSSTTGGTAVAYDYDPLNRLDGVNDAHVGCCTEYGYDAVGNLQSQSSPNGIASTYQYDLLNRLTNLTTLNGSSGLVAKYSYTVAPSGHRLTAAENVVITNTVRTINRIYSYDATYRLINEALSATGPMSLPGSANVGYTLDDVGNRLSRTTSGFGPGTLDSTSSTFDANDRLTSDTYDANGNTTTGHIPAGGTALHDVYDFEDHLINRNGGQVTVTYDGDGNRVSKTVGGVTTFFLVDDRNPSGYAQVLEEHTSLNSQPPTLNRLYTYGTDLISQNQWTGSAWTLNFYGYDGHGSVRYLTATNAAVIDTYDYDAFGTLIAQSGATPNNYLYCGEQFDADLGLYYNRARYLNVDSGRFWTRDMREGEIKDPLTLPEYIYGSANPISNIDPRGLAATLEEVAEEEDIDVEFEAGEGKVTIKSAQKGVKTFTCQVGRIYFERETVGLAGHHPLQKSLGGSPDQPLVFLPGETHNMFHSIQNIFLQAAGLLAGNASKDAWIQLYEESPASQIAAYQIALDTGKLVDKVCGFTPPLDLASFVRKEMEAQGIPGVW